jgi:hypothetical protein
MGERTRGDFCVVVPMEGRLEASKGGRDISTRTHHGPRGQACSQTLSLCGWACFVLPVLQEQQGRAARVIGASGGLPPRDRDGIPQGRSPG